VQITKPRKIARPRRLRDKDKEQKSPQTHRDAALTEGTEETVSIRGVLCRTGLHNGLLLAGKNHLLVD